MDEPMTKAKLLETLKTRRAAFDAALAVIPQDQMTQAGAAGYWAVKDIVAHLAYYEGWMADRMSEQLRGENYSPTAKDMMHWDERNKIIYDQNKDRALDEVLAQSRQGFQRLLEIVDSHSEAFLTQPQQFEGMPQPILVWDMLRSEVYDHYGQHIPSLKEWAAGHRA